MKWSHVYSLGVIVCIFMTSLIVSSASAQEPVCPPGFEWRRMSGVGCVQVNCGEIANAKYSYTSDCICLDGYKGCYEPVDYDGFDQTQCGPNCPYSALLSCISPDAACPSEEPAPGLTPEPTFDALPTVSPFDGDDDAPSTGFSDGEAGYDDLGEAAGEWITGGHTHSASAGQEAAGAVSATALLTAWILTQLLSGGNLQEILSGLFGSGSRPPQAGDTPAQASVSANLPGSSQPGTPPTQPDAQPPALQTSAAVPPTSTTPTGQPAAPPPAAPPPAGQPAQASSPIITDSTKFQQVITDKFNQILQDKVKDNYYVRNPDLISKIWNNLPIISNIAESWGDLKGGQCGEFANWGQQWIGPWAEETFGPGVIVDSIWVGESSSRYPDGIVKSADALYQANHTANRITLPNGDSYVVDFWDGMIKQRSGDPDKISKIEVLTESEWINKWRGQIETEGDPADICNLNRFQDDLRRHIASYDARHPSMAPPGRYQENNELVERAIQDWLKTSKYPPEIKQTIVANWRSNGSMWGMYRPDPPLDPVSAVLDSYYQLGN